MPLDLPLRCWGCGIILDPARRSQDWSDYGRGLTVACVPCLDRDADARSDAAQGQKDPPGESAT
jgi:hypothetical protein